MTESQAGRYYSTRTDGRCSPCVANACTQRFLSFDNWLDCKRSCAGENDPSDWLLTGWNGGSWDYPDIVGWADSILFRGCYRGQRSCHGPLDGIQRKLGKIIFKLDAQFKKYREHPWCGFGKSRGAFAFANYHFGTHYDLAFSPAPEHELNRDNFKVDNWIDENNNYDGCAAFQTVLDGKPL